MTELLYQTNSYLREFEATVTEVGELGVALDRTAFYPGGGGQVPRACSYGTAWSIRWSH